MRSVFFGSLLAARSTAFEGARGSRVLFLFWRRKSSFVGWLFSSLFCGTTSALAIPSPELVVGSLTSISQLIALGSALLGGGAAAAALRSRSRGGGAPGNARFLMGLAAGLL